jgi:ubiquinone/menaquinone biosynthesis C-methylase UbiE/DNA polymerase/3'-5' exonuclease PolX
MNAIDVADLFWETGAILSFSKGSRSKGQSFQKLARMIEELEHNWPALHEKEAESWEALSQDIQDAFEEVKTTGSLALHQELTDEYGEHAATLLRVRGIGPSMARNIQKTLDVWTIEALEEAAEDGTLLDVRGIGAKVLEQIKTQLAITKETMRARSIKREQLASQAQAMDTAEEETPTEPIAQSKREVTEAAEEAAESAEAAEVVEEETEVAEASEVVEASEEPIEVSEEQAEPAVLDLSHQRPERSPLNEVLQSPLSHQSGLKTNGTSVSVPGTSESFPIKHGVIDMLVNDRGSTDSLAQRVMEASAFSRIYENVFRPGVTRVLSGRSAKDDRELSLEMLKPEGDWGVLDVACGTGSYAREIAQQLDPARGFVIAIDLSWSMLERAAELRQQEGFRHLHLVRGDALSLPIADNVLEGVHCTAALHLFPEPDRALQEFHRVMQDGGRLVIGTFLQSKSLLPLRLLQRASRPLTGVRGFDHNDLETRIRKAGFQLERDHVEGLAISMSAIKRD